jgi:hypothetical protein
MKKMKASAVSSEVETMGETPKKLLPPTGSMIPLTVTTSF